MLAPGPGHSLEDRSLSIKLDAAAHDGFIVNSFAGDPPLECKDYVREKIGAEPFKNGHTRPRAINAPAKRKRVAVAMYDYRDADGTLLYQTVRYQPKDFRQRQPDGNGGWIWRLGDRRVLYRLPELLKYPDATVFVCEGEKDADRVASLGYVATTVASHKWTAECAQGLAGRDCWILEDNDKAGRKNALDAAEALHGYAKSIRIVRLSRLSGGDDVSDWLDAGHTKQEFEHACCTTPLWSPSQENDQEPVDLAAAFAFLGDVSAAAPQELISKLLPAFGVAVTGGQSSAGKTFIVIHRTICLGTANPYFGHRIIERVGTVLVAAEGRALIPNRFEAGLVKAGVTKKLPVAWIKHLPDFGSVDGIKLFITQLREIDKRFRGDFGVRLGHVPIDTIASCFAMKDEDDNAEATKVSNVLLRIGEEVGALMAPVHHYGKNPESGLRGASAWKGSADVVEGVLADIDPLSGRASNRELVCTKARDGEQGPVSGFELEWIRLGTDKHGEDYGSCAVVPMDGRSRFDKASALSKSQRGIQEAIDEAMGGRGMTITPRAGMAAVKAVKVSDVREEFDRRYVTAESDPAKTANAKRMAFKRALDRLSPNQFGAGSTQGDDWIWRIT